MNLAATFVCEVQRRDLSVFRVSKVFSKRATAHLRPELIVSESFSTKLCPNSSNSFNAICMAFSLSTSTSESQVHRCQQKRTRRRRDTSLPKPAVGDRIASIGAPPLLRSSPPEGFRVHRRGAHAATAEFSSDQPYVLGRTCTWLRAQLYAYSPLPNNRHTSASQCETIANKTCTHFAHDSTEDIRKGFLYVFFLLPTHLPEVLM
jgi:hypothetical protein